jgi:IS1 family transposase
MVGIRVSRLKLDEAWSFVGKKQKNVLRHELHANGDQYVFIAMAGTQKAIISWGIGKRNMDSTMDFLQDLRSRVIGHPEISTDGFHDYRMAIRDAFGDSGLSRRHRKDLQRNAPRKGSAGPLLAGRRSSGKQTGSIRQPRSTSCVERQSRSLRISQRRLTRFTNGFSKKTDNRVAAVALYVATTISGGFMKPCARRRRRSLAWQIAHAGA